MTTPSKPHPIPLALPIDGVRAGLLGGAPMDRAYMAGVRNRARMLARACAVKRTVAARPLDPYVEAVGAR